MSKGIGALQREIMKSLDIAMHVLLSYRGSGYWSTYVTFMRTEIQLHPDVYDLRAVETYLMGKVPDRAYCNGRYPTSTFQASFSRAVSGLISRGMLGDVTQAVPVQDVKPPVTLWHGADNLYRFPAPTHRRRFVVDLTGDKWYDACPGTSTPAHMRLMHRPDT